MRRIGQNHCMATVSLLGLVAAFFMVVGCKSMDERPALLSLKPARMTAKSVVFDMFFVRVPFGDAEINGPFWNEIDEQKISPESRQLLAENGFRAGVISGPLPVRLSRLLELQGKTQVDNLQEGETPLKDLQKAPKVSRRHLQLRNGRRGEILAQEAKPELSIIFRDATGKVSGESLYNAQPIFTVHTTNQQDGRVRVCLTPEIQHGEVRREFSGDRNGMFSKLNIGRDRKRYDEIEIQTELGLGDFLVLSNLPIREGSLGSHFFTESTADGVSQKLLIIRLSQTQHDDQFE